MFTFLSDRATSIMAFLASTAIALWDWEWTPALLAPAAYAILAAFIRDHQEDRRAGTSGRATLWVLAGAGLMFWTVGGAVWWVHPLCQWLAAHAAAPALQAVPLRWPWIVAVAADGLSWRPLTIAQWTAYAVAGVGVWWLLNRTLPARSERWAALWRKRTAAAREGRTDIRTVHEQLPDPQKSYDPRRYFKEGHLFLGLDKDRRPIYVLWPAFGKHPHTQVAGTTGCGKGVFVGLYMAQALRHGHAVVALDPKDDAWAPHVLRAEATALRRPFALVDLRQDVPQINLLAGASVREVEMLLIAGLGLSDRGGEGDHYRVADRIAARRLAERIIGGCPTPTLADLADAAEDDQDMPEGLTRRLTEAAMGGALSATHDGVDLAKMVAAGGAVYVIGDSEGRFQVMQRMLVVRVQQIAAARDRIAGTPRQIMLFLDEVKDCLSKPALDGLAKARDKGLHIVIAHQSKGDLRQVPGLDPDAVTEAVIENCKMRILYGVGNSDTAKWLAENSGRILVDDEQRGVKTTAAGVEQATGDRSLRQAERPLIDQNMWLALADTPGVAVVVAPKKRWIFSHICPVPVKKQPLQIVRGRRICPVPVPAQQEATDDPDL